MEISKQFIELTHKFLKGNLTSEESEALETLLHKKEHSDFFKEIIKDDYLLTNSEVDFNTDTALAKVLKDIKRSKTKSPFFNHIYKYAAAAVLLISVVSFWFYSNSDKAGIIKNDIVIEASNNKIELIHNDGKSQLLGSSERENIIASNNVTVGYAEEDKLTYNPEASKNLAYNTIKVPYGKTFKIKLSDGTKVDLNAGTTLKYPVSFLEGQSREVFLMGEAYFDVTPDTEHKFIVNTEGVHVEVLGTEFNVSTYIENKTIKTTLVEGAVNVFDKAQLQDLVLVPNEQSIWDKNLNQHTKTVVNTSLYTSWRNGILLFRKEKFSDIAKTLERSYDVTIVGYNEALAKEQFTANFDNETIEQIINYFSEAYGFNFTINGRTISIA